MKQITKRQKEVLQYIQKFQSDKGYSPSIREICDGMNISSSSTVHGIIKRLAQNGYLEHKEKAPRSLSLVGDSEEVALLKSRIEELEAQRRPDVATMAQHDQTLRAAIKEFREAVGD